MRNRFFLTITVYDWQAGLQYRNGQFVRQLKPGRYQVNKLMHEEIWLYDLRQTETVLYATECTTADRLSITVTGTIYRKIAQPKLLVVSTNNNEALLREWAGVYLRQAIASKALDEVVSDDGSLVKGLQKHLVARAKAIGIELVDEPSLSFTIPRSLKKAYESEVVAKKKALADLEDARGKTAVLRHLANAAKLVDGNPSLYKLLLSQKVRSLNIHIDEKQN